MNLIGGFFELELASGKNNYHTSAIALNTGRACLNYIFQQVKPSVVYVPFYTCNSLLEPIQLNKIKFIFYSINENLEIEPDINLGSKDYLIYINYFGLKKDYIKKIQLRYKKNLILDNTQAFFEKSERESLSFNSARKFFGVPDGAYLYGKLNKKIFKRNTSIRSDHLVNRLIGNQAKAFEEFQKYEKSLTSEIKGISLFSEKILADINFKRVLEIRKSNFAIYQKAFTKINLLKLSPVKSNIPFAYPLFLNKTIDRKKLYRNSIFLPVLWKDVYERKLRGFNYEKSFSRRLLPLPVDHRYNRKDINKVIEAIKSLI